MPNQLKKYINRKTTEQTQVVVSTKIKIAEVQNKINEKRQRMANLKCIKATKLELATKNFVG